MTVTPTDQYADILRNDLVAFTHRAFLELNPGSLFLMNWHVELIAAKLAEVLCGLCTRLIICVPPRHFKSFLCSVAFPAWVLGHDPTKQILSVSYGQNLADKFARQSRAVMDSPFYRYLFATRLSEDRNAVAEFETGQGGYRIATSVGGRITGWGGNIIIIDDPLNADDAPSDSRRKSCNDWYDSSLRNRLNRQGEDAIIIVTQRLHADDLVAHVQRNERWDVISLPVVAEKTERYEFATPYGWRSVRRETGDLLHSALLAETDLDDLRRAMGDYHFSAQFQQDPQPPHGLIVLRKWLKFFGEWEKPKHFDMILQAWDTANKATELSDFSVCTTWGVLDSALYLLHVFRRRLDFPALKQSVAALARDWNADLVLIEDKSSGTQLIQELRANGFSNVQAAPLLDGDKVMRLHAQTAKIEGGFVLFPREAPWLDAYLRELLNFPNTQFDDQVDSTVFALAWSTSKPRCTWTDESLRNLERVTLSLCLGF
jgi:predicted phage terminase large subunit-like protein